MDTEITFFRKCLMTIGINTALESEDGSKILFDYGIRKTIGKELSLTAFLDMHASREEGAELVRIFDGYLLSYIALILPDDRLLIGPYANALPTESFKKLLSDDRAGEHKAAVISAAVYGIMGMIIEFVMGTITMMMVGSEFVPAMLGSLTSLPATVINAVFMVIVIAIIYPIVKKIYKRAE